MAYQEALLKPYQLGRMSVYRSIEGLPQADAIWKPSEHVKSIQETLVHIGGAERFWLKTLGRDALDFPDGDALDQTETFLKGMEAVVTNHLKGATLEELTRTVSTDRGALSLAWMVKRITQHMFYHLGTLVYLRTCREPNWHGDAGLRYWQTAADAFGELVQPDA